MDFGGASTQITFETSDAIEDPRNEVMLKLYGQPYKVYTHSFLCYGRDQVLKRLLSKVLQVLARAHLSPPQHSFRVGGTRPGSFKAPCFGLVAGPLGSAVGSGEG